MNFVLVDITIISQIVHLLPAQNIISQEKLDHLDQKKFQETNMKYLILSLFLVGCSSDDCLTFTRNDLVLMEINYGDTGRIQEGPGKIINRDDVESVTYCRIPGK